MPFFVIKKGLVLLEWKYFPTPKILDPIFTYKPIPIRKDALALAFKNNISNN
ncbi:hypothetical protein AWA1501_33670 [Lactiplantibacillus pentosus]|nr:hypothetical protein AWA1501_33670 [Lactiplantibacillus pentosus]